MNFIRGIDPKKAMSIGMDSISTEVLGINVIALVKVFKRDIEYHMDRMNYNLIDYGPRYHQVGQVQIKLKLEPDVIHRVLRTLEFGLAVKPLLDEYIYFEFKKQQREESKYTSAPVSRDEIKVFYYPLEDGRFADYGIFLKLENSHCEKLQFMSGCDISFEGKFYKIPKNILLDDF